VELGLNRVLRQYWYSSTYGVLCTRATIWKNRKSIYLYSAEKVVTGPTEFGRKKYSGKIYSVRLTSIHLLQIEGNFTETSGGSTNLFYGCVD
jgi:hypothetical protein